MIDEKFAEALANSKEVEIICIIFDIIGIALILTNLLRLFLLHKRGDEFDQKYRVIMKLMIGIALLMLGATRFGLDWRIFGA